MMKKNFLLTVCLILTGILSVNARQSIVALHHEGNVSFYDGLAIQNAIDASVEGDTLYLSEGIFSAFTVKHGVAVIGSGINTQIANGDIKVEGGDNYVFSGLNFMGDFRLSGSVTGLKISQCQMENFDIANTNPIKSAEIVMSYIRNVFSMQLGINHSIDVINSKIHAIDGECEKKGAVSFLNCNIRKTSINSYSSNRSNMFVNCIIGSFSYGTFVNCVQVNGYGSQYYDSTHCWTTAEIGIDPDLNSASDEVLKAKGFIGTDGTVVGITGGPAPYTLELFEPHVTEHKLEVDNAAKKLKVTLKMGANSGK